nr:DUF1116 domain-containing protein [Verticiella sp. GG226]
MAKCFAEGLAAVATGQVRLAPAQDHGVVTPLAQVVSAGMPLVVVGDGATACYAPLAEAPAPALRFGSPDGQCVDNMRELGAWACDALAPFLRGAPVALGPIIAAALAAGEECHALTAAAHAGLIARLDDPALRADARLATNPGFVLTPLMAAAAWVLDSREHGLAAIGGNGVRFGVRARGATRWHDVPATAPVGTRFPVAPDDAVLGAIGDSAVLDACGLGGQALRRAPALVSAWADSLPADWAERAEAVLGADGVLDPARILTHGKGPLIHLAMVGAGTAAGLLGRGFYVPPVSLFEPLIQEIPA